MKKYLFMFVITIFLLITPTIIHAEDVINVDDAKVETSWIKYKDDLVSFSYPDKYFTIYRYHSTVNPECLKYHFKNDFNPCEINIAFYRNSAEYVDYVEKQRQKYSDYEVQNNHFILETSYVEEIQFLDLGEVCCEISHFMPVSMTEDVKSVINSVYSSIEINSNTQAFEEYISIDEEMYIAQNYHSSEEDISALKTIVRLANAYYDFSITQNEFKIRMKSLYDSLNDEKNSKQICRIILRGEITDSIILHYRDYAQALLDNQI